MAPRSSSSLAAAAGTVNRGIPEGRLRSTTRDGDTDGTGPDGSAPHLDKLPDFYPEGYWRTTDGATDERGREYDTSYFGALARHTVAGFSEIFDFIDWKIASLGMAEVSTRYTTEVSRGQVTPDVNVTAAPISMRHRSVADPVETDVSPTVSETDAWPDRYLSELECEEIVAGDRGPVVGADEQRLFVPLGLVGFDVAIAEQVRRESDPDAISTFDFDRRWAA